MNTETSTLITALVGIFATLLASILPNIISNHYQTRKDELEFYEKHRCEVIENYLQNTARHLYGNVHAHDYAADYGASLGEIYMYTPQTLWHAIDEMNELAISWSRSDDYRERDHKLNQAKQSYRSLCKAFSSLSRQSNSKDKKYNRIVEQDNKAKPDDVEPKA